MTKTDIIEHLNQAKAAHLQWVQRAHMLIFGFKLDKDDIPVDFTKCNFGKWLYDDGQKLCNIDNSICEIISEIEKIHKNLHDIYLEIFKIYFGEEKKGFFANIFGSKKKALSESEVKLANDYYKRLEDISNHLLDKLSLLQKRIHFASKETIESIGV